MSQGVVLSGEVKPSGEAVAKASPNRALSRWGQTRSGTIYPCPGWRAG